MSKRRKYRDGESTPIPEPVVPNQESTGHSTPPRTSAIGVTLPLQIGGSLLAAVILMTVLMIVLAWGTFVEAEYGTAVARFAVYDSFWFTLLIGLLAVNILCSLLLRLPWKRSHIPFVVAHTGILVLLAGCFLTWSGGEEAQISIYEGMAATHAVKPDRRLFEISTISYTEPNDGRASVKVPFSPGPFNWDDYDRKNWFQSGNRKFQDSFMAEMLHDSLWMAMQWGGRDSGRLTLPAAANGVQIEVLDYLASSGTQQVAPLELSVLWKRPLRTSNDLGEVRTTPRNWESLQFDIFRREHPGSIENRGIQMKTAGGERINFFVTDSPAEVAAFRNSGPDTSLKIGNWGQLVLHQDKKNYFFDVDQLIEDTRDDKRVPLGDSGFSISVFQFLPRAPGIRLVVHAPNGEKENIVLFADSPDFNVPARKFGVFGTYWLDPEGPLRGDPGRIELPRLENMAQPRLDILQGPGRTLYYRFWTGRLLASSGEVLVNAIGTEKPKFSVAQGTPDEAEFVIDRFFTQDLPGQRIVALPVGKKQGRDQQRVRLRVNVDGNEETFWLQASQSRFVYGKNRTVRIGWDYDQFDLGFGIFLKRFEKRSEPGRSRMPAHYSSLVDFVQLKDVAVARGGLTRSPDDFTVLQEDVLIRMNRPAVFQSSTLSRRYWFYQNSYGGPYHPGDPQFTAMYDGEVFPWESRPRESLYFSVLSLNADPGRGLKYLGCFLIVLGSVWLVGRRGVRS